MKKFKQILCIFLAVSLLSGLCVCFADSAKDYTGYRKYVSLGDSIADGIGENNVENKYMYRTPGAYPDRIAREIGAELTQLGCGGMRTVELRACLEDNYIMPDEFANNFDRNKVREIRSLFAPAISDADIITLTIGSNDIMTYALLRAQEALAALGINLSMDDSVPYEQTESTASSLSLNEILSSSGNSDKLKDVIEALIDGLYDGYNNFCRNWDSIIADIYTLNPDVTLLVTGFYNPFPALKISDSSALELGRAADSILELLNNKIKYNSPYSNKYIYVDIMGVESLATKNGSSITDDGFFKSLKLDVHPSNAGQAEIAKRIISRIPAKSGSPFTDITWNPLDFRNAIDWAYAKGITLGKSADKFAPHDSCTRGQIITMLWRAAGSPKSDTVSGFTDISADSYYYDAVCWAAEKGIAKGITDTQFGPDYICARAQIVTFIYRYAGSPSASGNMSFADIQSGSYCYDAVNWAVNKGITKGVDSSHFAPGSFCTRAQAVTFMYRYMA